MKSTILNSSLFLHTLFTQTPKRSEHNWDQTPKDQKMLGINPQNLQAKDQPG